MEAELFLARQDLLGEGILVQTNLNRISWVDILGKRFMTADLKGGNVKTFQQDTEVGAVLPGIGLELIVVLRNSVIRFEPTTATTQTIWSAEKLEPATNRFNDAAIDPFGNLWIGSMDFDAEAASGVLYRLRTNGQIDVIDQGYACINGPAFSGDGKTVYVGDTMRGQILAYSCEPASQAITDKRVFLQLGRFEGLPDGMAVDSQDNLWVCRVTAGLISCYAPDGTKLKSVALPVPNVTSCCFGGPGLSTLFATTARIIHDPQDLDAFPQSGSLYKIQTENNGRPPCYFGAMQKAHSNE